MKEKVNQYLRTCGKIGLLLIVFAACLLFVSPQTVNAKAYMKQCKIKWDLKKNKKIKINSFYAGGVKIPHWISVQDLKITKAKKKGYKQLICTYVIELDHEPTEKQISKMIDAQYDAGADYVCSHSATTWIVDYQTGENLEYANSHNVYTKFGKWKNNRVDCYCQNGEGVSLQKTAKLKMKVVYPAKYKNMCIGLSGNGYWNENGAWDGTEKLKDMPVYKKNRSSIHFMRIR